jgi:UDP:flavonoid glycosyltransferase YjiC (YdhE family)
VSRHRRALLVCHDAGGTVPPMVAVGQALLDRGGEVVVLSQPSARPQVEIAGCRFLPFSSVPDYERGKAFEEQADLALPVITGTAVAGDLLELVRSEPFDVVVIDANLAGGLAAAETLDFPSAVLLHSMYKTFVDTWFMDYWPFFEPGINETRSAYGLSPVDGWSSVFAGHDRLISVVPAAFEASVDGGLPATLRNFGFLVPRPGPAAARAPDFAAGEGPTVLVALSTTYQQQETLLQTILDAVGRLPVRGLVTTGGQVDIDAFDVPANVVAAEYVPHALLLPHTDVMVTHAGMGTVAAGLSFGVPLVCTPMSRDQPLNAERVAAVGAGVALAGSPTVDDVAGAVNAVLAEPAYRRAAESVAAASRAEGGPAAAAADLESLLG